MIERITGVQSECYDWEVVEVFRIERITGVQRICYNDTIILPIRPYSKEEQQEFLAEINRCAEEYANFTIKTNEISTSCNFEELLQNAIHEIELENEEISLNKKFNNKEFIYKNLEYEQKFLKILVAT